MQLSGLRHLHLHKVWCDEFLDDAVVLSSLQQLTYLCVTDCSECISTPAALKHLAALTSLQHLVVRGEQCVESWHVPLLVPLDWLLPLTQLTALELTQQLGSIPAPGLAALPKLQRLCLSHSCIDLATLAAVRGLEHFSFYGCRFDCESDCDSDCGSDCEPQERSQPEGAFFSWLQLQPLTHLSIQHCKGLDTRDARVSAQACAAVTASTALRELHCPWLLLQLPAKRQLLQLTALTCSCSSDNAKQLVRCCPAVKQLELATWLQPELLLPLTGLTSLSFPKLEDDELPQLLQLTRLQALSLTNASISDQGLKELAALRQLTRLVVWSEAFSRKLRAVSSNRRYVSLRKAVFGPPVWQQVVQHCRKAEEHCGKRQQRLQQQMQAVGLPLNPEGEHGYHLRAKQRKSYKM